MNVNFLNCFGLYAFYEKLLRLPEKSKTTQTGVMELNKTLALCVTLLRRLVGSG